MRKITLLGVMLVTVSTLFCQTQLKWNGGQTDQLWDYATPNWLDPGFPIPIPKTFTEGVSAIFDDTSIETSDTIKIVGALTVDSIKINASKTYVLRYTASTDAISGNGTLIKDGTGNFVMDVKNNLLGGTVLKNGRLTMEKQATPNIFGAKLVFDGGIANFATTTASTYPSVTLPVIINAGKTAVVELSRYSYWSSQISGSGDLVMYAGGERTYLGQKNVQPDWKNFTGNVTVDKYVMAAVKPGFYGLILNTNKTFKDSLDGFNMDSTFYNRKLTLNSGTTIGAESGTRSYLIGEINSADTTTLLAGYYKDSTTPKILYFIGGLNTDVVYPGRIGYIGSKAYNQTGIVKIGTGTYTLTNNNNQITSGLTVRQGRVLVCDKVLRGTKNGGTGYSVVAKKSGTIGGTGRIAGNLDVFGTLQPGADGIGTLLISDSLSVKPFSKYDLPLTYSIKYTNTSSAASTFTYRNGGTTNPNVNLHAGSVTEIEIASATSYDKVVTTGKLKFGIDSTSIGKPKIKIKAANGITIKDGDKFEVIVAGKLDTLSKGFDIEYPVINGVTWSVVAKYDTLKIDKEEFTFTDHIVTKWTADSVVTTVVKMDSAIVKYKVIVTAHGSTALRNITKSTLKMYPNPVVNEVNFESAESVINTIEIINLQGQIVYSEKAGNASSRINLKHLPSGIYYAKVHLGGEIKTEKLILK